MRQLIALAVVVVAVVALAVVAVALILLLLSLLLSWLFPVHTMALIGWQHSQMCNFLCTTTAWKFNYKLHIYFWAPWNDALHHCWPARLHLAVNLTWTIIKLAATFKCTLSPQDQNQWTNLILPAVACPNQGFFLPLVLPVHLPRPTHRGLIKNNTEVQAGKQTSGSSYSSKKFLYNSVFLTFILAANPLEAGKRRWPIALKPPPREGANLICQ